MEVVEGLEEGGEAATVAGGDRAEGECPGKSNFNFGRSTHVLDFPHYI